MAAKYWLKTYYEMLDDPKIGKLRPALRWRFTECLLVAGECDDDGYIPDSAEYAWRVRASEDVVDTELTELAESGLLSRVDGRWHVTKFNERQAAVSNAERQARFRARQHKAEYYTKDTEVLPSSNEDVTIRNTDTDKIRIDNSIVEGGDTQSQKPVKTYGGSHHELPPDEVPHFQHNERRRLMVAALTKVTKTTITVSHGLDGAEQAVDAWHEQYGDGPDEVLGFLDYWRIPGDGKYTGRPALKSMLNQYGDYVDWRESKGKQKSGGVNPDGSIGKPMNAEAWR